ncbi:MAG TPA: nucleotidyltransferase domain-containing protein [Pyrinomonadaceae bacterium]
MEQNRPALLEICRRFNVRRLYVFGSAATGGFKPASSDLDFLVDLADREPTGDYADRYLGLAESLETLFSRPVDLLTEQSLCNPYLRREVRLTRELIYEDSRTEADV